MFLTYNSRLSKYGYSYDALGRLTGRAFVEFVQASERGLA